MLQRQAAAGDNHGWSGPTSPEVAGCDCFFFYENKGSRDLQLHTIPIYVHLPGWENWAVPINTGVPFLYRVAFCISRFYKSAKIIQPNDKPSAS
jgi:hypothetical protein